MSVLNRRLSVTCTLTGEVVSKNNRLATARGSIGEEPPVQKVKRRLRGPLPDLTPRAQEDDAPRLGPAQRGEGEPHRAHRLVGGAATRTRDAGDGDGESHAQAPQGSFGHGARHL